MAETIYAYYDPKKNGFYIKIKNKGGNNKGGIEHIRVFNRKEGPYYMK